MTDAADFISLSAIDEERFGIKTARSKNISAATLPRALDFCRANNVVFWIARCSTEDLDTVQSLEKRGFLLMDTLLYYSRDLSKKPIPGDVGQVSTRTLAQGDEQFVRQVANDAFADYFGHYHADKRLDKKKCDEVYASWAYRLCVSRDAANEVYIAEMDGAIVGFGAFRVNNAEEGEGVLFGVAPHAQGKGIYRSFMIRGMEWSKSKGCARMVISTQITNTVSQKVWTRLGFEPSRSYYTFHKWLDEK